MVKVSDQSNGRKSVTKWAQAFLSQLDCVVQRTSEKRVSARSAWSVYARSAGHRKALVRALAQGSYCRLADGVFFRS